MRYLKTFENSEYGIPIYAKGKFMINVNFGDLFELCLVKNVSKQKFKKEGKHFKVEGIYVSVLVEKGMENVMFLSRDTSYFKNREGMVFISVDDLYDRYPNICTILYDDIIESLPRSDDNARKKLETLKSKLEEVEDIRIRSQSKKYNL